MFDYQHKMHNVKQWALCQVWSVETFRPEEKTHTVGHTNRFNLARAQIQQHF